MKRIILGLTILAFATGVNAQDAADKKVQAGLVVGYGMNFQKMGTKLMESDGVGSDLTLGANVNFSFTETIGLSTGIEFDFETLKYKSPAGNPVYYFYRDENNTLVESDAVSLTDVLFKLDSRKQKPLYLTLPLMVTFRTNFIGYFRYYGKFGLRTSVLLSNKFTDEGTRYSLGIPEEGATNSNMTAKGEMFFIKSSVGAAGGAEWNFVGSTCLLAEIGYYYGFTPLHNNRKDGEQYLFSLTDGSFSNKATQSQLMFKVSILF
jgi:hypothetical protein